MKMPWSPTDGPSRHTKKASTPAKSGDEGKAVRIANAAVAKHPSRKSK
jgi:hypothetical protein